MGRSFLTTWRTFSGCATPAEDGVLPWNRLLSRVIDDTEYLASVSADERGRQAVANIEKFRDQVRTWSENSVYTAVGLLHRIDRQAEIASREGEADIPVDAEGVRIMTIHSAKGLEFLRANDAVTDRLREQFAAVMADGFRTRICVSGSWSSSLLASTSRRHRTTVCRRW